MNTPYYADAPLRMPSGVYAVLMTLMYSALTLGLVLGAGALVGLVRAPLMAFHPELGRLLFPLLSFLPTTVLFLIIAGVTSYRGTGVTRLRFGRDFVAGLPVGFVASAATLLLIGLSSGKLEFNAKVAADGMFWLFAALALAVYTVQGGTEEVMMRGLLARSLGRRLNPIAILLFTSVAFSLMHIVKAVQDPFTLLSTGILGAFMFLVALNAGSLWMAIGFHGAFNFTASFLSGLLVVGKPPAYTNLLTSGVSLVGVIVMALILNARKPGWHRATPSAAEDTREPAMAAS